MALFKTLSRNYRRYDRNRRFDWAPTHALTLACWFYGNHASIDQHLIGMPVMGYRLFLRSLGGYSYLSADLGVRTITNPEPIIKSQWIHAAMVWTGTRLKLFSDGDLVFAEDINDIRYMNERYGTSIWAFENTFGGNSYQLGLNLFTMWGSALSNLEVEYLAEGGNPANAQYEGIRIGDFLDEPNRSDIFGDFMPNQVVNDGIIHLPPSPFPGGVVPYPVPIIIVSSSSSSESSESSLSSVSSESTSLTSSSSTSSQTLTASESSESSSSSSGEGVIFNTPGEHPWTVPTNVFSITTRSWGAGGGGGGALSGQNYVYLQTGSGGGGGGGAYEEAELLVTPGEVLTIVVGEGGIGGSSWLWSLFERCGSGPHDGEDGGATYIRRVGPIDLVGVGGGEGGGAGYTTGGLFPAPRGGEGGSGGAIITGGTAGNDGDDGVPAKRAFFWPPIQPGGAGGLSGNDDAYGKGGDGSATDNRCRDGLNQSENGRHGRVEITYEVEESSSSSTQSSSSSPDESTSSSTGSTGTSSTSESSAG